MVTDEQVMVHYFPITYIFVAFFNYLLIHSRMTQIWPWFLKFLVSPENFVPFDKIMDLAKDLAWQKIFGGCSTNLKNWKIGFFCIFATLTPYFVSFPDTQWAHNITTEIINIKARWNTRGTLWSARERESFSGALGGIRETYQMCFTLP